ncbi:MAG: cobalt-precorrin-6A reductase [Sarcina sp.]
MIGLILGTSEGKIILKELSKHKDELFVSTATTYGGELLKDFNLNYLNNKALSKEELKTIAEELKLKLILDGTHPYAKEISKNILEICKELNIEYVRYERKGDLENFNYKNIYRISKIEDLKELDSEIKGPILNTTGSNGLKAIMKLNFKNRIIHRVLPSEDIIKKMLGLKINIEDIIAIKGPINYELNKAFLIQYNCDGLLTKDSGKAGGALEKALAAKDLGLKLIIIEKPKITYGKTFSEVTEVIDYLNNFLK